MKTDTITNLAGTGGPQFANGITGTAASDAPLSSAVGYYLETIRTTSISNITLSLNTPADITGMQLTLEPGDWMLWASVSVYHIVSSLASGPFAELSITDTLNNIQRAAQGGMVIVTASPGNISQLVLPYRVSLAVQTTFKLRITPKSAGGTPVWSSFDVIATANSPMVFSARRVR
jgi:hypothetical protein